MARGFLGVLTHPLNHGATRHRMGVECFLDSWPPDVRADLLTARNGRHRVQVPTTGAALLQTLRGSKAHKYVAVERAEGGVEFHLAVDGEHQTIFDPQHERIVGAGLMTYDVVRRVVTVNGFSSTCLTLLRHVRTAQPAVAATAGLFAVRGALTALLGDSVRVDLQLEPALPLRVEGDEIVIDDVVTREQGPAILAHLALQSPGLALVVAPPSPDAAAGWWPAFRLCTALYARSADFSSITIRGPLTDLLAQQ